MYLMYRKWHFGIINILMDSCSIKFMKMKIKNITVNEHNTVWIWWGFAIASSAKHFKCLWFNFRQEIYLYCSMVLSVAQLLYPYVGILLQWRFIDACYATFSINCAILITWSILPDYLRLSSDATCFWFSIKHTLWTESPITHNK